MYDERRELIATCRAMPVTVAALVRELNDAEGPDVKAPVAKYGFPAG
jgi:hypothetical protein